MKHVSFIFSIVAIAFAFFITLPSVQAANTDLSLAIMTTARKVTVGDGILYSIRITNSGSSIAESVVVQANTPAGLSLKPVSGCSESGSTVTCVKPNIVPNGTSYVTLEYRIEAGSCGDTIILQSSVTSAADSNPSNNSASFSIPISCAYLTATIVPAVTGISHGQILDYTLTITNTGAIAVPFKVVEHLTNGLTYADGPTNCALSGANIECLFSSIAPRSSRSIVLRIHTFYSYCGAMVQNTVSVESLNNANHANRYFTSATTRLDCPDLSIALKSQVEKILPTDTIQYTATVTNSGSDTTSYVLRNIVPESLTYISGPPSCSFVEGRRLECPISAIGPGAKSPMILIFRANASCGEVIANTMSVHIFNDTNPTNNTGSIVATVACPHLNASITPSALTIGMSGIMNYKMTVTNSGSISGPFNLLQHLPFGLEYVSGPTNCALTESDVLCSFAGIKPGFTTTLILQVRSPATGCGETFANTIDIIAPFNTNSAQNTVTSTSTRIECPDLSISIKSAPAQKVLHGNNIGYAVFVTNSGSVATPFVLNYTIPTGFTLVSAPKECTPIDAQNLRCPFSSIPAKTIRGYFFTVKATAACGESVSNMASVSSLSDQNPSNDSASVQTLVACPHFSVSIAPTTTIIGPEQSLTYQVVVTNNGSITTPFKVTQHLPDELIAVSNPYCTQSGGNVLCSFSGLAPGAKTSFSLQTKTRATPCGASIINTVSLSAPHNTNEANSVTTAAPVQLTCTDLSVSINKPVEKIMQGNTIGYAVSVTNTGSVAVAYTLSTDIPAGLSLVTVPSECTVSGMHLQCSFLRIQPGAKRWFNLYFKAIGTCGEAVTQTINVSTVSDTNLLNNTSNTVSTTVTCESTDLSVSMTGSLLSTAGTGTLTTVRLTVRNAGPLSVSQAKVTIAIPSPMTYVPFVSGCTVTGGVLTCKTGIFSPEKSQVWTLKFTSPAPLCTPKLLTAVVSSSILELHPANNTSTVTVQSACTE